MTPTPNPTAERVCDVIAETIRRVDGRHSMGAGALGEHIEGALRAHGLLSEGAPSEEQVERAAKAYLNGGIYTLESDGEHHARMRAALNAAGVAPQEPREVDPRHTDAHDNWDAVGYCNALVVDENGDGDICNYRQPIPTPPTDRERLIAEAKAEIELAAHGTPATHAARIRSGDVEDNRLRLIVQMSQALAAPLYPVKVAEVLNRHEPIFKDGQYAGRCICGFEHPSYSGWRLHRSGALCEAYTEGKLT